jgi:two-component system nitrate/nitrite response regulator NarL
VTPTNVVAPVSIVVLTGSEDEASGVAALRAGADGYVARSAAPEHLIPPILAAAAGMAVLPGWVRDRLVAEVARPRPDLAYLSEEELIVLTMICEGREATEIARRISVSERTLKRLTAALFHHMGVTNRVPAAVLAARAGLCEPV